LLGAVDCESVRPDVATGETGPCVIGGLANKNAGSLLEALDGLPEDYELHLFGKIPPRVAAKTSDPRRLSGRLHYCGPLFDDALTAYYHRCDMIVMTERGAGWANLAAEALACGRPLITTPHGTSAFARDRETALICPDPTPEALSYHIETLWNSPELRRQLSCAGRKAVEPFSWALYTRKLLQIISELSSEREGGGNGSIR